MALSLAALLSDSQSYSFYISLLLSRNPEGKMRFHPWFSFFFLDIGYQ